MYKGNKVYSSNIPCNIVTVVYNKVYSKLILE